MTRYIFTLLLLTGIGLLSADAYSQKRNQYNGKYVAPFGVMSLTGGVGVAYYMGDLSKTSGKKNLGIGPAVSIGGLYRLTEQLSARGELRFYQVSGGPHPITNLSFRTRNPDLNLGIQADLFAFNDHKMVNPYLYGGLGLTYLTPQAEQNGTWYKLPQYQTGGVKYNRVPLVITGGIGVSVQAFDRLSLGLELNNTYSTSDYLDDVSGVFPEFDKLPSEQARQLSDRTWEVPGLTKQEPGWHRGTTKISDMYLFLQFRATYLIGNRMQARERKKTRCPKF
ncbi:outer membrane beta-barrel protein [Dyadobacter sp. CY312]|uniref:outer membrane beta-barrel protein n=1 Tax=Dyadobacter sp. CY312 TaxID=2907303 RepID=UPI001F17B421|nr:outer membrane beta-barrel protein [Dyadobacter sp. CY312]MCE7041017.1 outer membrane beta-barrel protein [Dyadobacter sp. CY312]